MSRTILLLLFRRGLHLLEHLIERGAIEKPSAGHYGADFLGVADVCRVD